MAYGAVMLYFLLHYFLGGRLWARLYSTTYSFKHLAWLPELSVDLFCLLVGSAMVGSLLLICGLKTRLGAALLLVGCSYLWLLEKSSFKNHYYMISLLALLFIFVGGGQRGGGAPAWKLWIFRFQISVVYFYAGVAKIQPDWLAAEPISIWFGRRAERLDLPWLASEWTHYGASLGSLYLDLFAPLFLLWKPGRWIALPLLIIFHCTNQKLFSIGVFPSLMLASCVLFLDGEELRSLWPFRLAGGGGAALRPPSSSLGSGPRFAVLGLLVLYAAIQVLVPLRHFILAGDPSWTDRGHWFSWRMMLRSKISERLLFYRHTEEGTMLRIPRATRGLSRRQIRVLSRNPQLLEEYARKLSRRYGQPISVVTKVRLNRGQPQALIEPTIRFRADGPDRADYILPLVPREQPRSVPRWALYLHLAALTGLASAAYRATGSRWWLAVLLPAGVGAVGAWASPYLVGLLVALGVGFARARASQRGAPLWSLVVSVPLLLSLAYLVSPHFTLVG